MKKFSLLLLPLFSFAELLTFDCKYPIASINGEIKKQNFSIRFIYESKTEKAYLSGNNGTTNVKAIPNLEAGITFLELSETGNVTTSTINFVDLKSVHSRHTMFNKELLPQQFYGKCEVK